MESQLQRPYGHTYDDPQKAPGVHSSVVEDEGEHHHENKSVLKKVKAKAKKIKDTLKKHGHDHERDGHDQERDYHHEDHDEEEEDEDEEIFEDPEVHGAPMYESTAIGSAAVPSQGINLEKPTAIGEDRYGTKSNDQVVAKPGVQGQQQYSGQAGINLERPTAPEVAHAPEDKNVVAFPTDIYGTRVLHPSVTDKKDVNMDQQGARIDKLEDLQDDPNYARPGKILVSNYETKLADPTGKGGEEAEMSLLIRSLDKMSVSDESVPKPEEKQEQSGYTGSHDQFAPQPFSTTDEFASKPLTTSSGSREPTRKSYDPSKPEELPRDTLTGTSSDESGLIEKISTATSVIADKATSAKNVVASKLGYGATEGAKAQEMGEGKEAAKSASPTGYTHNVAATVTEKMAPVYQKVAAASSSVISKVKGTTNAGKDETPEMTNEGEGKVADKGVSVKEYLADKFKPGEEDKALSEVISESWHKKNEELGKSGMSKPTGKVTESEEVARHLGSGTEKQREGDDAIAAGSESTGKGFVDRIKDAVGLWVGKGNQEQNSQGSPGSSVGDEKLATGEVRHPENTPTEERRLQGSG